MNDKVRIGCDRVRMFLIINYLNKNKKYFKYLTRKHCNTSVLNFLVKLMVFSMLENLIMKEEGKTLEFKENTQSLNKIIQTIIAFANTAGGTIIIGVKDKTKKITGIQRPLNEEEKISNAVTDSISPLFLPNIEIHNIRNKELLVIKAPHAAGPFYLKKYGEKESTFIRLGSTNRKAILQNYIKN